MTVQSAALAKEGVYLDAYLAPFQPWLAMPDVTEVLVNRPGEVWIERVSAGQMVRYEAPQITDRLIERLAQQLAARSHQAVSRRHPLLAASLLTGERVQVVLPPATRGHAALAIRRQVVSDLSLADYVIADAFGRTRHARPGELSLLDRELQALLAACRYDSFFSAAVKGGKNIIVSGGTSSGKTTFLNALLKEVPSSERLIAIEDTPELVLGHANALGLVAARGDAGEARVSVEDLLQASLRLRPDRILLGELRGREAYSYLRAVNSGHPGSITTVHADSCLGALEQIALMVLQAGFTLLRAEIVDYVRSVVDIVVQLRREGGRRFVDAVLFEPRDA